MTVCAREAVRRGFADERPSSRRHLDGPRSPGADWSGSAGPCCAVGDAGVDSASRPAPSFPMDSCRPSSLGGAVGRSAALQDWRKLGPHGSPPDASRRCHRSIVTRSGGRGETLSRERARSPVGRESQRSESSPRERREFGQRLRPPQARPVAWTAEAGRGSGPAWVDVRGIRPRRWTSLSPS